MNRMLSDISQQVLDVSPKDPNITEKVKILWWYVRLYRLWHVDRWSACTIIIIIIYCSHWFDYTFSLFANKKKFQPHSICVTNCKSNNDNKAFEKKKERIFFQTETFVEMSNLNTNICTFHRKNATDDRNGHLWIKMCNSINCL